MRSISRREFIRVSSVAVAGATLAACAKPVAPTAAPTAAPKATSAPAKVEATKAPAAAATTAPAAATKAPAAAATTAPAAAASRFKEAPKLAEQVKAGKLPPVEQRLPTNPWVVPAIEQVGKYGGRLRRSFTSTGDKWGVGYIIDRGWLWYDKNLVLKPRLAESFEVNKDATEYIFHLRKGTKWSDGTPYTAQEVVWFRKYVLGNTDITPAPSSGWGSKGADGTVKTMDVEAPDDYTVKLKFAYPAGRFVHRVNRQAPYYPSHFMKQWHKELADPAKLEAAIKQAGVEKWELLFDNKRWYHLTPDLPVINGWMPTNTMDGEIFNMVRNPYFFGVDSEGNQLPYIDEIVHRKSTSPETTKLWAMNGELDIWQIALRDYSTFKANESKGSYRLLMMKQGSHMGIQVNMTVKDEKLRTLFRKKELRLALSYAVDRNKMNEILYEGMAIPRQYSPISVSPDYYEKLTKAYLEYDPKKAGDLLDQAGYKKGADGVRTHPDGTPVTWIIESTAVAGTPDEDGVLMVVKYLNDIGLKVSIKPVERNLYDEHVRANEIQSGFWGGDRVVVPIADSSLFIGTQADRPWCPAWAMYYGNPKSPVAEEPPKDHFINNIWAIWTKLDAEPDDAKRHEYFRQILDIWYNELPFVCYLGEFPAPILAKNGMRNFVAGMPIDDPTGNWCLYNPEQYFWEDAATQSK